MHALTGCTVMRGKRVHVTAKVVNRRLCTISGECEQSTIRLEIGHNHWRLFTIAIRLGECTKNIIFFLDFLNIHQKNWLLFKDIKLYYCIIKLYTITMFQISTFHSITWRMWAVISYCVVMKLLLHYNIHNNIWYICLRRD